MNSAKTKIRRLLSPAARRVRRFRAHHVWLYLDWYRRDFAVPAPAPVKWRVLFRYGSRSGVWVETGTYMGDTTAQLAKAAARVISLEPEPQLAAKAKARFADDPGVTILNATSEIAFPSLLDSLSGDVSFWLDGHYSAGVTFKGDTETPIRLELSAIEARLPALGPVAVLVDDFRCFGGSEGAGDDYPKRSWLVDWAERNALMWTVEHDIFVAYRRS